MPETYREKRGSKKINREVNIANKKVTTLLVLNGTRVPPQGEDNRENAAAKKRCNLCNQSHINSDYFWELEKMQKIGQLGG